jgi:hypothetical protein
MAGLFANIQQAQPSAPAAYFRLVLSLPSVSWRDASVDQVPNVTMQAAPKQAPLHCVPFSNKNA